MCVEDSKPHGGKSTKDRVSDPYLFVDLECGGKPAVSSSSRGQGPKAPDKKCNWCIWGPVLLVVLALGGWLIYWKFFAEEESGERSHVARQERLNKGTTFGFIEAVGCGRDVTVLCNDGKKYPVKKVNTENGFVLDVVSNAGLMGSLWGSSGIPEMKEVQYVDNMGARVEMSFQEWGKLAPKVNVIKDTDTKNIGQDKPEHFENFLSAMKNRVAMRCVLDRQEFDESTVRKQAIEVIWEDKGGVPFGYVNLISSYVEDYAHLTLPDFEERLQLIVWEDGSDDMQMDSIIKRTGDYFKNNLEFELVKDEFMWGKLIIWHTKLRNACNNEDPSHGVWNMKAFNKDRVEHRSIEKIIKRNREDGSFYLVIHVNNKIEDPLDDFSEFKWRTGCDAAIWNKANRWGNADNQTGTCNIDKNRDVIIQLTTDKFDGKDKHIKELEELINKCNYSVEIQIGLPLAGPNGKQYVRCKALRMDCLQEGTSLMKFWTWARTEKSVSSSAEKNFLKICPKKKFKIASKRLGSIRTIGISEWRREYRMCLEFVHTLTDYMDHKWEGTLKESMGIGRKLAWGAAGVAAVGALAGYAAYKMSPGGVVEQVVKPTGRRRLNVLQDQEMENLRRDNERMRLELERIKNQI